MLLTSSQVSVLLSFGIVLFFTAALFLSGVAIQQRTLRDLRKAIRPEPRTRPNPSPKIYLPDRFRKSTTELEDGTVVEIDDPEDEVPVVEVRLSGDVEGEDEATRLMRVQRRRMEEEDEEHRSTIEVEGTESKEEPEVEEKVSSYERRRRIKEEIQRLAQGDSPVVYQRRLW